MNELILFLGTFIFVYLVYLVLIILRKKKMDKYKKSTEVRYLENKYKLDIKKLNLKKLSHILDLANAFIIAITILVISFVDDLILKLMVGFIVLFPMILIIYHIIGKSLQKKYGKK